MSVPRSILKKRPTHVQAGPSKPRPLAGGGSKLKHTIAIAKPKPKGIKRARPELVDEDEEDEDDEDDEEGGDSEENGDVDMGDEEGTDDEIERAQGGPTGKFKKATKKKPPTSASTFGETLTSLLAETADLQPSAKRAKPSPDPASRVLTKSASKPSSGSTLTAKSSQSTKGKPKAQAILSLSRGLPPSKSQISLEHRARVKLRREKEEREDRARIRDIAEGWAEPQVVGGVGGMEFEKTLRKTAQRGVIKLFNAILVASKNADPAQEGLAASMGGKEDKKRREKDNVLGRGRKDKPLTKEGFLDMVRKG